MGRLTDRVLEKVDPYQRHHKRSSGDAATDEFIRRVKDTAKQDQGDER